MGIEQIDSDTNPAAPGGAAARHSEALHRNPAGKDRLLARLRRIEGQVRGLGRMVDEERYCPEILAQVAAVQSSLRGAAELLLQDHLRHCVTTALRSGDPLEAESMYRELTDLFKKYGR
jgi:DNA-binding FrmR family transcriptional regulator